MWLGAEEMKTYRSFAIYLGMPGSYNSAASSTGFTGREFTGILTREPGILQAYSQFQQLDEGALRRAVRWDSGPRLRMEPLNSETYGRVMPGVDVIGINRDLVATFDALFGKWARGTTRCQRPSPGAVCRHLAPRDQDDLSHDEETRLFFKVPAADGSERLVPLMDAVLLHMLVHWSSKNGNHVETDADEGAKVEQMVWHEVISVPSPSCKNGASHRHVGQSGTVVHARRCPPRYLNEE